MVKKSHIETFLNGLRINNIIGKITIFAYGYDI